MRQARIVVALVAFLAATMGIGCSGASPAGVADDNPDSGENPDAGYNPGWDGQTNIEAIFEASCSGCHGTAWASCWDVQASSTEIESEVASGAMPQSGALSASDKATLLAWLDKGAPCTGPRENPDNGGSSVGGGGPPLVAGDAPVSVAAQ